MNRFLVFAGSNFYPSGGWKDFIATFTTRAECMACLQGRFSADVGSPDWAQIVDTQGGSVDVYSERDFQ